MMKSKIAFAILPSIAVLFTLLPHHVNAKIWRVNNNPIFVTNPATGLVCDHCFTNLQDAVYDLDVMPGDTLHLEASPTSYGGNPTNHVIINKRLVILGPGYFLDKNPGLQHNFAPARVKAITLDLGSKGTIIKGLSIGEIGNSNITIKDDNLTIERCYVDGEIYFQNSAPINNITIKQNYVDGTIDHAGVPGPVTNLIITNNYFSGIIRLANNYQGITTQNVFNNGVNGWGNNMSYYNNIIKAGTFVQNNNSVGNVSKNIFHNAPAWLNVPSPNNYLNVVMATVFPAIGSTDGILDPLPSCTNCQNGQGGNEIGMYGGPDPYRLSGVPDIPAIGSLAKVGGVVQGGGLPVTVKTRTNN